MRSILPRVRFGWCSLIHRSHGFAPPTARGGGWVFLCLAILSFAFPAYSQLVKLNSAPAFVGTHNGVSPGFQISADGSKVVFTGDFTTLSKVDLYAVSSTTAGTQIQLSSTTPAGDVLFNFIGTPDLSSVVFGRYKSTTSSYDLNRVSTTASGTETTLAAGVATNSIGPFWASSDGTRVVFQTQSGGSDYALKSALVATPGAPLTISSPFPQGNYPRKLVLVDTPSGTRAVFAGELATDGLMELFSSPIDSAGNQIKLNNTPVAGGEVFNGLLNQFRVTGDGSTVVYLGDLVTDGVQALFRASTTAAGTQTALSSALHPNSDVFGMLVAENSNRTLYLADLLQNDVFVIFEAATTGPPNQQPVFYPTENYFGIREVSMTPDEDYLIFRGSLTTSGVNDLYCTPSNFLFAPRRVTQLLSTEDVDEYRISPDSSFVVYKQTTNGAYDESLWVVSSTGAYAPVEIGPVPANHVIQEFEIKPDNSGVVFTAYEDGVYVNNLYSAPIPSFTTVANPIPATQAAPIPGANLANQAPLLSVTGKTEIRTSGKPVTVRGTATPQGGVASVLVTYKKTTGSGKKRTITKPAAFAGTGWSLKFRPKEKVSKLSFVAVGTAGQRSRPVLVKIVKGE